MSDENQSEPEVQYLEPSVIIDGVPEIQIGTFEPPDELRAMGAVRQKVLQIKLPLIVQMPLRPETAQQLGNQLLKGEVIIPDTVPPFMTGDGPPPPGTAA